MLLCEFCYQPRKGIRERTYMATTLVVDMKFGEQVKRKLWLCNACVSEIPKEKLLD